MDSQIDEVVPASKNGIKSEIYRTVLIIREILKNICFKIILHMLGSRSFLEVKDG
jgi:hypothetical protein